MPSKQEEKPLLASGSIVGSYKPLYKYWEIAESKGIEKATILREDLEFIEDYVRRLGRINLLSLRRELTLRMIARVDPEAAEMAYRELNLALDTREAQRRIAEILAGWALEAAEILGIISLRRPSSLG